MSSSYSMEGVDLQLNDGVIELRAQGERKAGSERAPASAFTIIAKQLRSRLVLYDIRDADYDLTAMEWEERTRFVARLFKGYRVAYVIRSEQHAEANLACEAHARNGDPARAFTSKSPARDWLTG